MKDPDLKATEIPSPPDTVGGLTVPPLQLNLNPDDYREELAELDLTEQQENELLEVLCNIMSSFVAMGYRLDSVQLFSTTENEAPPDKAGRDSSNSLAVKDTPQHFNQAAILSGRKED